MAAKPRRYRGDLARPVELRAAPTRAAAVQLLMPELVEQDEAEWQKRKAESLLEVVPKFGLLFDEYGIDRQDENRWFLLAMHLAFDHVPGFGIAETKPTGRPATWSGWRLLELYIDVEALRRSARHRDRPTSEVCAILAKRQPWKNRRLSAKTMENHWREAEHSSFVAGYKQLAAMPEGAEMAAVLVEVARAKA